VQALLLAVVAIAALVWEQRQRPAPAVGGDEARPDGGPSARRPSVHAADGPRDVLGRSRDDLAATLLRSRRDCAPATAAAAPPPPQPPPPLWSSLRLRTVGLSNLVGLLLQIGVGVGVVLPRSGGGAMLEVVALNDFALFAQARLAVPAGRA
jgi:hypothetical protein